MVEIIPKQERKGLIEPNTLFVISLLVFFVILGAFFLLQYSQSNVKKNIQKSEASLVTGPTIQEKQLEEEMLSAQKKVKDFNSFLALRKDASLFFQFFEHYTHPKVFFTDINVTSADNTVKLQGEAQDFLTVEDQIALFTQRPQVQKLELVDLAIGTKGNVIFTLDITFLNALFTQ